MSIRITATGVDRSIERVRAFVQAQGWSVYRAAAEAGLSGNALAGMFRANWNPRVETLRAVEQLIPPDFNSSAAAA